MGGGGSPCAVTMREGWSSAGGEGGVLGEALADPFPLARWGALGGGACRPVVWAGARVGRRGDGR